MARSRALTKSATFVRMSSHQLRLRLIGAAFALVTIALVLSSVLGATGDVVASLVSAEGLLVAAIIDAVLVERRRRNPDADAVGDDVKRDHASGPTKLLALLFAVSCATSTTGCGAGGISAAILAAKPAIDVSCHVARMSCAFVDTACTTIGSPPPTPPTSGGESTADP